MRRPRLVHTGRVGYWQSVSGASECGVERGTRGGQKEEYGSSRRGWMDPPGCWQVDERGQGKLTPAGILG